MQRSILLAAIGLWASGCATAPPQPVAIAEPNYKPMYASSAPAPPSPTAYHSSPTSGAYTGNCLYPDDLDAAGRRCGARSAYSRPGGYEPTYQPSYSYTPTSTGSVQVRGYYRRDGTYVRSHSRRR